MKERRFFVDVMQVPSEVTGSFTIVIAKIDDKTIRFAIDCGLYQEKGYFEKNSSFPVDPEKLDFVILSHNHVDHNGRIPMLVKKGFHGKVYMTNVTECIIGRALYDNAKIIKEFCQMIKEPVLFTEEDVGASFKYFEGYDYNVPVRVNENITFTFVPNGHLIGAASILVQVHCPNKRKEINLFFTGDYNSKNLFFKVPTVRKWITRLPVTIITESTYGKMDSCEIKKTFRLNILKAVKEMKTVVIPVFSLGRAQEILYHLKVMQNKHPKLFANIPIFYDGNLSFYYTTMYYKLQKKGLLRFYKEKRDFLPNNISKVTDKVIRSHVLATNGCKIIVTTSGMGNYGPAATYLPYYISSPNALIHFTGYCAEDTLGSRMKNVGEGDQIFMHGGSRLKFADVQFTNEFSGHSKADELIGLLKSFEKPLFILVNHGEDETKEIFAKRLEKEFEANKVGILGREYFYRIGPDGFIKSITSKL